MKQEQLDHFSDQGYLRLEGFHSRSKMLGIKREVLGEIKRGPDGRGMSRAMRGVPIFQQIAKLSGRVNVPGLHEKLVTPELIEAVARLGGRAPSSTQPARLLLSPPSQGAWTLGGLNWHVDMAANPRDRVKGIQAFFLIDDVAPQGGATLALAGSHRAGMPQAPSVAQLRGSLGDSADLERRLRALGIALVEMSGRAGDVFMMDMRLLHTPSVNSTPDMRMMATSRCFLET